MLFAEGHGGRIQISGQVNVAKGSDLTLEQSLVSANLSVYFAPGGVNDASSVRKSFGAVLDQAINRVMFTHVLEEVFLAPTKAARERLGSQCLGAGLTALHNTVNSARISVLLQTAFGQSRVEVS